MYPFEYYVYALFYCMLVAFFIIMLIATEHTAALHIWIFIICLMLIAFPTSMVMYINDVGYHSSEDIEKPIHESEVEDE